jgi:hypothetical protein
MNGVALQDPATLLPSIEEMIVSVRGEQVVLDADLASLYRMKTKALLQAVKRNRHRFPQDFVFQLTSEECMKLTLHFRLTGRRGGRRYRPHAFTEQGAAMLASVIHNPVATQVAISILRTFARLRATEEPPVLEDRTTQRAFSAIRDAFVLQKGDGAYTTRAACTYFVQAGGDGPIKIGSTNNLVVRLRTLCAMSPVPLKLLRIVPSDVEEACHVRFGAFRLHGEWFAPSIVILEFIREHAITPGRSRES